MSMKQRSISALKAKKHGDFFENVIMFFANRAGYKFIKIPNGCKYLPNGKIIPVKTPFDFILSREDQVLFIDAKTTEKETFPFSAIDQDQVRCLDQTQSKGTKCGYVIDLNGNVVFVEVNKLKQVSPGESLKKEDGVFLGITRDFDMRLI